MKQFFSRMISRSYSNPSAANASNSNSANTSSNNNISNAPSQTTGSGVDQRQASGGLAKKGSRPSMHGKRSFSAKNPSSLRTAQRSVVASLKTPGQEKALSQEELETSTGIAEDVLPGLLADELGREMDKDVGKIVELLGGHIRINEGAGESTVVTLQKANVEPEGICFETLDVLEQIACFVEGGPDSCAAVGLPSLLIACLGRYYGLVVNDARTGTNQIGKSKPSESSSSVSDDNDDDIIEHELTASENEDEDEEYEDEEDETTDENEEADSVVAGDNNNDNNNNNRKIGKKRRIKRKDAVFQRVTATLCHLLTHMAVMLSLIRSPDYGLETLFFLIQDTHGTRRPLFDILDALCHGQILPVVLDHIKERNILPRLLESIHHEREQRTITDGNIVKLISAIVKLLLASCRTSQVLLDHFRDIGGYVFLHETLLAQPLHTEQLLTEIRQLVYLGPGFAEAESEAEHLGVVHSVFLARNEAAFAVVAELLFHLQYAICGDDNEQVKKIIWEHHSFAWGLMSKSSVSFVEHYRPIRSADSLRLPLLHCVLTIYSSNPVNFGILDEKFGVMSTLLISLGASLLVHDEFLFMIAKLLELISMGMDYRPKSLLETICRKTLPNLVENRHRALKQVTRLQAALSFDLGAPDELTMTSPSSPGSLSVSSRKNSPLSSATRKAFDKSPQSAGSIIQSNDNNPNPPDQEDPAAVFVMNVLCKTLIKMVRSDEEYKDILREAGLLDVALFPFIRLAASKQDDEKNDVELFKMLPVWCSLLSDMVEGNLQNENELRTDDLHQSLYNLIPAEPQGILKVIMQMARRDSAFLEQDISALLELVQQEGVPRQLKVEILFALTEMMKKNHQLKDMLRKLGGFESLLAILLSLEASFASGDPDQESECVALMEKVFEAFTIAMTGNHIVNRAYMKEEIRYESLSSTCQLIGIFGKSQDADLVDMVLDCATEAIAIVNNGRPADDSLDRDQLRIRNVDPLQILTIRISLLSKEGLARLLQRLCNMVHGGHSEQAANCEILCQTVIPKLLMEELFDKIICDPDHELHKVGATLLGSFARHHSTTRSTQHLLEKTFVLYEKKQLDADEPDLTDLKGVLQMLNLAANPGNDDAFFCPYVQMAGPSDVFVLPSSGGGTGDDVKQTNANNNNNNNEPRKVMNPTSHRSFVQNNSPGNIHVATLGKRTWPPSTGYTLSMWVWLGKDVGEEVLLGSIRTNDGSQPLRITLDSSSTIRIRGGSPQPGGNLMGGSASNSTTKSLENLLSSLDASSNTDGNRLAKVALEVVMAAAESTANLTHRMKYKRSGSITSRITGSSPSSSAKERFLQELMPFEVSFSGMNMEPERWHHIAIVHRSNANMNIGIMLDKSSGGRIALYCDGKEVGNPGGQRFPYPTSAPNAGLKTSFFVGLDPVLAATRRSSDPVRFWRLGPFHLLDCPKDEPFARAMYLLGVNYNGTLTRTCATLRDARTFTSVLLERLYAYEQGGSVITHLENIGLPHLCWKELLQWSNTFLHEPAMVELNNVVFSFFAGRQTTLEGFPSIDTQSLIEKNIREIDVPRTVLINSLDVVNQQQSILAVLGGGAFAITPLPLCDSIRSVGGIPVVLRMLELTREPNALIDVLDLLRNLLSGHEYNRFTFRQSNGHRMLAWLLFDLAQNTKNIFTPQVFETMLNLAVLGTGKTAVIVDPEMLHQLILNHQVWRGGEKTSSYQRWRFVIIIVQWLSNLVDEDNVNVQLNLDALHRLNIIDWVLEIMLSLAVDIPPEEGIISDVLAAALQFLYNLNKQMLVRRSLFELFKHILVSLPVHSEDYVSDSDDNDSMKETHHHKSSSSSLVEVPVVDDYYDEHQTSDDRSATPEPKDLGLGMTSITPVSTPGGGAGTKKKPRRRTVTDLMISATKQKKARRRFIAPLPSSDENSLSVQGERILRKVRCMLFQLLMDLPEAGTGTEIAKHRSEFYSAYSDILSVHWFNCLFSPSLDSDTMLLSLRLLTEVIQESQDFAHHFISAGGFLLITKNANRHPDLRSMLFMLTLMLFGIPAKLTGPPIIFTPNTGEEVFPKAEDREGAKLPEPPSAIPLKFRAARPSGLTLDGRISSFVSPEVKKRLLSRKSTVESSSSVSKVENGLTAKFESICHAVPKLNPPNWYSEVFSVITGLLTMLIGTTNNETTKSTMLRSAGDSDDELSPSRPKFSWTKSDASSLCEDFVSLLSEAFKRYPETPPYFMSKSVLDCLTELIFQEATMTKITGADEGYENFTGPITQSILTLYVDLLLVSIAEDAEQRGGHNNHSFKVKTARKVLETMMQSFPIDSTSGQVLWFQTALIQACFPKLSLMLDDKTWNARRSSGSKMSLPHNADPGKLVTVVCFITGRASFGWVPGAEHTILELIGQANRCIDAHDQRQRILRCIRGLILWTFQTSVFNSTVEDNIQFLRAVLRNFDMLEVDHFCSSLVPTSKQDPRKRAPNVAPSRDPYLGSEFLPETLRKHVDMYDESTLFVFCFIHLIFQQLAKLLDKDDGSSYFRQRSNMYGEHDEGYEDEGDDDMPAFRFSKHTRKEEIEVCLLELLHAVLAAKQDLANHFPASLRSGFKLILDQRPNGKQEFIIWFAKEYQPIPAAWLDAIWDQVQRIELFGSPMQCGLTNAYNLRASLAHLACEETPMGNHESTPGSPSKRSGQKAQWVEDQINERLKGKRKLLEYEVEYMKKYRSKQAQQKEQHEEAVAQVAEESKELMESTQKDAVDRHRRWQRVGLEHLLRGKKFWQAITDNFRCGIYRDFFEDIHAGDEKDPTKTSVYWMLDASEGRDRMRRRLEVHLDFSKTFHYLGALYEEEQEYVNLPQRESSNSLVTAVSSVTASTMDTNRAQNDSSMISSSTIKRSTSVAARTKKLEDDMNQVFRSIVRKPNHEDRRLRSHTDTEENYEMCEQEGEDDDDDDDNEDDMHDPPSSPYAKPHKRGLYHRKVQSMIEDVDLGTLHLQLQKQPASPENEHNSNEENLSSSDESASGKSLEIDGQGIGATDSSGSPRSYETFELSPSLPSPNFPGNESSMKIGDLEGSTDSHRSGNRNSLRRSLRSPKSPFVSSSSSDQQGVKVSNNAQQQQQSDIGKEQEQDPTVSPPSPIHLNDELDDENEEYQMTIEDEIAELGWETAERILTELEYADRKPEKIFNCGRVSGMETIRGIGLICETSLYFVSNYEIKESGMVEELAEDTTVYHSFDVTRTRDGMLEIVPKTIADNLSATTPKSGRSVSGADSTQMNQQGGGNANYVTHDFIKIRYDNIREVYRRRFMLRETGMEVFSVDGFSYLLVFEEAKERDWIFTKVLSKDLPNLVLSKSSDYQSLASQSLANSEGFTAALMAPWRRFRVSVTKKWKDGEISNFGYLMYLNTLAGRSHNDLTQYPVFPWVLSQYSEETLDLEDPSSYRDLSKPMGALNAERVKQFTERYNSLASVAADTNLQPFHYGTHYSCSAYVLQFLIRLEPFTRLALELQGGQFDRADRLFHSFPQAWRSASGEDFNAQDVRELPGEFFYLPESLENINNFDLGTTQRNVRVSDVTLPPWSKGDPHHFIRMHRRALESRYVSEHIHEWIDLIFGYKQRGREAIEALNVFHPLTYEGEVNIDEIEDPVLKKAAMSQIHSFGQTPRKLFSKPHPKRTVPQIDPKKSITSADPAAIQWHSQMAPPLVIPGHFHRPGVWTPGHQGREPLPGLVQLVRQDSTGIRYIGQPGPVHDVNILQGDKGVAARGNSTIVNSAYYVTWGSENGSLCLHQLSGGFTGNVDKVVGVFESLHHGEISSCCVTDDGKQIWTGGADAIVSIWRLRKNKDSKQNSWCLDQLGCLANHTSRITCLAVCPVQGIAVSGSKDGSAILWDEKKRRFIRQLLKSSPTSITSVGINSANGNVITLSGNELQYWHVNGNLLANLHLTPVVHDIRIDQPRCAIATNCDDYQFGVVCVTGHSNGTVCLWDLPDEPGQREFALRTVIPTSENRPAISALGLDHLQRRLAVGDVNGRVIVYASFETTVPLVKASEFFSNIGKK